MVQKVFELLLPHPEDLPATEVLAAVAGSVKLTGSRKADIHSILLFVDSRRSFDFRRSRLYRPADGKIVVDD
jgi:hypothetical protein